MPVALDAARRPRPARAAEGARPARGRAGGAPRGARARRPFRSTSCAAPTRTGASSDRRASRPRAARARRSSSWPATATRRTAPAPETYDRLRPRARRDAARAAAPRSGSTASYTAADDAARLADGEGGARGGSRGHGRTASATTTSASTRTRTSRRSPSSASRTTRASASRTRSGFRAGIAHPFRPWDVEHDRPLDLVEIPLAAMDVTLAEPRYLGLSARTAERRLVALLDWAAEHGGGFSVLWHTDRFDRGPRGWDRLYLRLIEAVRERGGVCLTAASSPPRPRPGSPDLRESGMATLDRHGRCWGGRRRTGRFAGLCALLPTRESSHFKRRTRTHFESCSSMIGERSPDTRTRSTQRALRAHSSEAPRVRRALRGREQRLHAWGDRLAERTYLYAILRTVKPRVAVETGVANGFSTAFALLALAQNGGGELYSIDFPREIGQEAALGAFYEGTGRAGIPPKHGPGWLIPEYLREPWTLQLGRTQDELPPSSRSSARSIHSCTTARIRPGACGSSSPRHGLRSAKAASSSRTTSTPRTPFPSSPAKSRGSRPIGRGMAFLVK